MKIFDYSAIVIFFPLLPPDLSRLIKYTKKVEFVVQSFVTCMKEKNNVRHPKLMGDILFDELMTGDTLFDELVKHL